LTPPLFRQIVARVESLAWHPTRAEAAEVSLNEHGLRMARAPAR
jgi:hypothetical protein